MAPGRPGSARTSEPGQKLSCVSSRSRGDEPLHSAGLPSLSRGSYDGQASSPQPTPRTSSAYLDASARECRPVSPMRCKSLICGFPNREHTSSVTRPVAVGWILHSGPLYHVKLHLMIGGATGSIWHTRESACHRTIVGYLRMGADNVQHQRGEDIGPRSKLGIILSMSITASGHASSANAQPMLNSLELFMTTFILARILRAASSLNPSSRGASSLSRSRTAPLLAPPFCVGGL